MGGQVKRGSKAKTTKQSKPEAEGYGVERIVRRRTKGGKQEYEIKWINYPEDENTWEPEDDLIKTIPGWLADFRRAEDAKDEITKLKTRNQTNVNCDVDVRVVLEGRRRAPLDDSGFADAGVKKFRPEKESAQRSNSSLDCGSGSGDVAEEVSCTNSVTAAIHPPRFPTSDDNSLAKENSDLKHHLQEKDKELGDLRSQLMSIQTSIDEIIRVKDEEIENAKRTSSRLLKDMLEKKCYDLHILQGNWQAKCKSHRRLKRLHEEKGRAYNALNVKLQKTCNRYDLLQKLLEQATAAATTTNSELKGIHEREISTWKEKLNTLQLQIKNFEKGEFEMKEKFFKLEADNDKLQLELDRLKKSHLLITEKACEKDQTILNNEKLIKGICQRFKSMKISLSSMEKLKEERGQLREMYKEMIMMSNHKEVLQESQSSSYPGRRRNSFSEWE